MPEIPTLPPIEKFLPPPPDEVIKSLNAVVGSLVDGIGTLAAVPGQIVKTIGDEIKKLPTE